MEVKRTYVVLFDGVVCLFTGHEYSVLKCILKIGTLFNVTGCKFTLDGVEYLPVKIMGGGQEGCIFYSTADIWCRELEREEKKQ